MQTWEDTSGAHLNGDGLGEKAEARFDKWWHDAEAQKLIRQLIDAEEGALGFTEELEAIRQEYISELPWNDYSETYYADLVHATPDGDTVNDDPIRFLYMREFAV